MLIEEVVAAWCKADHARAVLRADHEIVDAAVGLRALVVERAASSGPKDELFDACAMLGRIIADGGGSPTLASATIDGALEALGAANDAPWAAPARAAVAEGFARALCEGARREAMQSWEYPACVVPLGGAALAIAAGHPSDDDEAVAAWAARVANAAARAGARRAVVAGGEKACAAIVDACSLVGIEVRA